MLTKKDLENIQEIVYKNNQLLEIELRSEMLNLNSSLKTELKEDIFQFKDEMLTRFNDIEKEVTDFKDEVFGKFKDIQEDIAILAGHQDVWEDHENRLTKVENKIFTN